MTVETYSNRQAAKMSLIKNGFGNAQVMVYIILIALLMAAQMISPGYLKPTHVAGILRLASFMGIDQVCQLSFLLFRYDVAEGLRNLFPDDPRGTF